jgi:hypothetical protein
MSAHGRVVCLDAASGREIWAINILERFDAKNITWALSECLLVDRQHLIVTPGGRKALMAALDKRSGRTVWTTMPATGEKTSYCSPILFHHDGRRVIANCSAEHGFGVDADTGKLLWTVPLKNQFGTNISTPIYANGLIYYVTPYAEHGRAYRLDADGGGITARHVWTCKLDTVTGGGVLVDNVLFSARYRRPEKWWFGLDWQTGKTKYELKDLTTGAAIYADGRLYCLDERGNAALLQPDGLKITGRLQLPVAKIRGDAWAHPVLNDGRLYLRYHDTLWCYDVRRRDPDTQNGK